MASIDFLWEKQRKLLGLAASHVFDRLGPELYFPDYHLFTFQTGSRQPAGLDVTSVALPQQRLKNGGELLNSSSVRQAIREYQSRREKLSLLVYKNSGKLTAITQELGIQLLANPVEICKRLENKIEFRSRFRDTLRFPPYEIVRSHGLTLTHYQTWRQRWGTVVLQHPSSAGGKGTFIITNAHEYQAAVAYLQRGNDTPVIASQFIEGTVASVQACVSRFGVFSSGVQTQVIGHPDLAATGPGAETFCGAVWGRPYPRDVEQAAADTVQAIGRALTRLGYRGIFGVDLIIDRHGHVYVLEINPRLTGLTSVLTMLQHEATSVSMLLLHILELAGAPYNYAALLAGTSPWAHLPRTTYLIFHNTTPTPIWLSAAFRPGVYEYHQGQLLFIQPGHTLADLTQPGQILLTLANTGGAIAPGKRFLRILSRSDLFTNEQTLRELLTTVTLQMTELQPELVPA